MLGSKNPCNNLYIYRHFAFFYGGHLENHPKWRVGPKIPSVNILILNQGGPITILYHTRRVLRGCMVTPPGPWTNRFSYVVVHMVWSRENLTLLHVYNKGSDQPTHLQSDQCLRYLLSEKYNKLSSSQISMF